MAGNRRKPASDALPVELAIALPVVILAVIGLMDFGRLIWAQTTLNYAVQEAARCAAVNATLCGTDAQIQNYAVNAAVGLPVNAASFLVTGLAGAVDCGGGVNGVRVEVKDWQFEFVASPLFPYSLTLAATACYPRPTD